jgi:pseudaminic acid cytidylyltransferase
MKPIAVIPARGGSQRIPRKNVREFAGKPMIAHSIEAALESDVFDRVVVSTDDAEISEVAIAYGAESPFQRPADISDGHATLLQVMGHAVRWFESQSITPEFYCCLFATAPFVRAADLRSGFQMLSKEPAANFAVPVTTFPFPIQRAFKLEHDYLQLIQPEHELTRSQDLPETFHDAGQFYWGRREAFKNNTWVVDHSIPIHIPRWLVQDIDTPEDWERAELLWKVIESMK